MPSVTNITIQTRLGCARTRRKSVSTMILGSFGLAVTTAKAAFNVKHCRGTVGELDGMSLLERRAVHDLNPAELLYKLINAIFREAWALQADPSIPIHLHRFQPDPLGEAA